MTNEQKYDYIGKHVFPMKCRLSLNKLHLNDLDNYFYHPNDEELKKQHRPLNTDFNQFIHVVTDCQILPQYMFTDMISVLILYLKLKVDIEETLLRTRIDYGFFLREDKTKKDLSDRIYRQLLFLSANNYTDLFLYVNTQFTKNGNPFNPQVLYLETYNRVLRLLGLKEIDDISDVKYLIVEKTLRDELQR